MYGCNKLYCEHLGRYYARHYRQLAAEARRAGRLPGDPPPRAASPPFTDAERRHQRLRAGDAPRRRAGTAVRLLRPRGHAHPVHGHARRDHRPARARSTRPPRSLTSPVYNVTAFSPSAGELADLVRAHSRRPRITFAPDRRRQAIVDSWPEDVDDAPGATRLGLPPRPTISMRAFDEYLVPKITRRYAAADRETTMYGDDATADCRPSSTRSRPRAAGRTSASSRARRGPACAVSGREVLNFCANNYLGLASEPALIRAARDGLERWGLGLSSVRFICGTQTIHKELEAAIARFLGTEDAILYTSCFDANGGLFETLLDEQDAVISDALNHASIIDGIRLCKAQRHRYAHATWGTSSGCLKATQERGRG